MYAYETGSALLKSLFVCIFAITALPLVIMGFLYHMKVVEAPLAGWIIASLLALLITGLMSFIYIASIFGPYETSIRMRLVREIAKGKEAGISFEALLKSYSDKTILDIRLRRLVGSGDVIEKDGIYYQGSKRNFFFAFETIALTLKKWIGR